MRTKVFWAVGVLSGAAIPFIPLWVALIMGVGTGLAFALTEPKV